MKKLLYMVISVISFGAGVAIAQTHTKHLPFILTDTPIHIAGDTTLLTRGQITTVDLERKTIIFATPDRFDPRKENFYKLTLDEFTAIGDFETKEVNTQALAHRISSTMLDKKLRVGIKNSKSALYVSIITIPRTANI